MVRASPLALAYRTVSVPVAGAVVVRWMVKADAAPSAQSPSTKARPE